MLSGEQDKAVTDLESHLHIVAVRVGEHEESGEPVTIVTTNLNLNSDSPTFDKAAFDELRNHVERWQRERHVRVTIEGPV
jgi:hypothetical protein